MKVNTQKRLAGVILKCSANRIWLDKERLTDIKEAITKIDIRNLIKEKAIVKKPVKSISRVRARKAQAQKRAGKRRGHGSRKGTSNARESKKTVWINHVRAQREVLKNMKEKKIITPVIYTELYNKSKGGFFRSKKHLKLYIEERHLAEK